MKANKPYKFNSHITVDELKRIKPVCSEWFEVFFTRPDGSTAWFKNFRVGVPQWSESRHLARFVSLHTAIRVCEMRDDLSPVLIPATGDAVTIRNLVAKYLGSTERQRLFQW